MADITDLPIENVEKFLIDNGIENEDDAYNVAYDLIMENKPNTIYNQISIIEWLYAWNSLDENIDIPNYTEEEIINLSTNDIQKLADLLNLRVPDKDHIINILKYAHKLNFRVGFTESTETDRLIIENSDLHSLKELYSTNQYIKNLINEEYPDLYEILKFLHEFDFLSKDPSNVHVANTKLYTLIKNLLIQNKYDLVRKILKYLDNTFKSFNKISIYQWLLTKIITISINEDEEMLIKKIIRILPHDTKFESLHRILNKIRPLTLLTVLLKLLKISIDIKSDKGENIINELSIFYKNKKDYILRHIENSAYKKGYIEILDEFIILLNTYYQKKLDRKRSFKNYGCSI